MERNGLDISAYQSNINFDIFKSNKIEFLILRGGFTGYGTGTSYVKDRCFENFYKKAKNKSIPIGVYWYSCANTKEKGINEAKFLYNNCLKGKQFEYPIYIDVEDSHHQSNNKKGVTEAIIGFCEYLEKLGYYVGIYASDLSGFKDKMYIDKINKYALWVARYGSKPKYVKKYGMWQTSSSKKLVGYIGNIDSDICYIDYPKIIKSQGFNGYKKKTETKKEEVKKEEVKKDVLYIVKKGDCLCNIAKKYNTTVTKIAKDNDITNVDFIKVGQALIIKK